MACHGVLDRHKLILEACETNSLSQEDYLELGRAGVGTCLLDGLPDWLIAYSAHLVVIHYCSCTLLENLVNPLTDGCSC